MYKFRLAFLLFVIYLTGGLLSKSVHANLMNPCKRDLEYCASEPANQSKIRVAVASNFYAPLKMILSESPNWQRFTLLSAGATGLLYTQIKNGAPFDVFLSADMERPRLLEQQKLAFGRQTYAQGELVLWPAKGSAKAVLGEYPGLLAIANPNLAPYGFAAEQMLSSFNLSESFHKRLLQANNVNQAFQFIATGNAKLGVISKAQLEMAKRSNKYNRQLFASSTSDFNQYIPIPQETYQPIKQQLVGISKTKHPQQVKAFIAWLLSDETQAKLNALGYQTTAGKLTNG